MCKESDLVILVVDADQESLHRTCESLLLLGISREKMICVNTYEEAVDTISCNSDIDIVLADFNLEDNRSLGPLLCSSIKKIEPGIFFILTSKKYNCSIVMESIKHNANDIFDITRDGEIENLMKKWIHLAKEKNITKDIVYGNTRPTT